MDAVLDTKTLYERFGPAIYAKCLRILGVPSEAQDAAHEVFLRAHQRIRTFDDEKHALRWLYRVATNHCISLLRKRKTIRTGTERLSLRDEQLESNHPENAQAVRLVLERVPKKLCEVAILYYVDGFQQAEIADFLGITRRTVINRLQDFQRRARKVLEP